MRKYSKKIHGHTEHSLTCLSGTFSWGYILFVLTYCVAVVEAFAAVVVFSVSSLAVARPKLDKNRLVPITHRGLKVALTATAGVALAETFVLVRCHGLKYRLENNDID